MPIVSPETKNKLDAMRQRMAAGQPVEIEDMILAVKLVRADRFSAATAAAAGKGKRAAAAAAIPNGDDLLNEMLGGV